YLWGYPRDARLEDDSLGGPEANCTASFSYDGPAGPFEGIARYSKTVRVPAGLVIETDKGYVVLGDNDSADIVFRGHAKAGVEQIVRREKDAAGTDGRSVTQLQLEDFVDACRSGRAPLVDGKQGVDSLRLLEQLYANRKTTNPDWYGGARE